MSGESGAAPGTRRVLMVTPSFYPRVGGAEKQALELSKALAALGLEVRVLTRRLPGLPAQDEIEGVGVRRLGAFGAGALNSVSFFLSLLFYLLSRSRDYDAVHVHLAGSPAVAAGLAGLLLRRPAVVKIGGGRGIGEIAVSSRTRLGRLKLALLKRLPLRLAAVTEDLRREMRERGFLGPIELVSNGVDAGRYRPASAPEKAALRAELGWPAGLGFLYTGRLAPEKRLEEFVRVFDESAGGRAAFLVLAGEGPCEASLRKAIARARHPARLFLLGPRPDIRGLYAASDVFILPSVSEGLSNALLEAMASGLAVLASRVGGTPEAARDGQEGLLFAPLDEGELKRQLERFLEEPGLAARLGESARRRAIERYGLEAAARAYLALYAPGKGGGAGRR